MAEHECGIADPPLDVELDQVRTCGNGSRQPF
jgi:hypothetical protein